MTATDALAAIAANLSMMAEGRQVQAWPQLPSAAPQAEQQVLEAAQRLGSQLDALRQFSMALAEGRLDADAPPRNQLLAPLKSLQSNLRHLTWQTQEVAAGHFDHRVDFLGEFSQAFNQMIGALRDKRRTEQEAMRSSQMASIGQLAAGLAHEINSPIQFVGDNLRFLATSLPTLCAKGAAPTDLVDDALAAIDESIDGIGRVARIVASMKEFALPSASGASTIVDLHRAIDTTLTVAQHEWHGVAEVERRFAIGLPMVIGNPAEINQLLLHLLRNAVQAIQAARRPRPGRVVIETMVGDGEVCLNFIDDGHGVPAGIRDRIFDPFFTTREVGKGMGLGLAICRDIVVGKHGGRIEVGGVEGEGAIFTVWLPADRRVPVPATIA